MFNRLRKRRTKRHKMMEADLTPMIDVTFQLIAFFMFLINFTEIDRAEEILLPSSVLAKPPEEPPAYQILMNLEPGGEVNFQGKTYDFESLEGVFNFEVSAAQREGTSAGDISVIIRAHEDTPTGLVQKLIATCQQSKLQSFSLRVKEQLYK